DRSDAGRGATGRSRAVQAARIPHDQSGAPRPARRRAARAFEQGWLSAVRHARRGLDRKHHVADRAQESQAGGRRGCRRALSREIVEHIARRTRVIEGIAPDAVPYDELMAAEQPAILKGLARNWPLVRTRSAAEAVAYLKSFYKGQRVVAFIARPQPKGRLSHTPHAPRPDSEPP